MQTGGPNIPLENRQPPSQAAAPKPKLLDQVRQAIRARHYSKRTEKTYVDWIKRFIFFHGKRHPLALGEQEINEFLTHLAVAKKVSASTQNQALSAILFLYQHVLKKELQWIEPAVRAKRPKRLRFKDFDSTKNQILVRDGKGQKDRITTLPASVKEPLLAHLRDVYRLHRKDLRVGFGRVVLPYALARKYPNADSEWSWQWAFPAPTRYLKKRRESSAGIIFTRRWCRRQ